MKKYVLGIAALAAIGVVVYGALAWYCGGEISTALAQQQAIAARELSLQVVSDKYQRGVFSSTAVTTVELRGRSAQAYAEMAERGGLPTDPPQIELRLELSHGPLPRWIDGKPKMLLAHASTSVRLLGAHAEILPEWFGKAAPPLMYSEFFDERVSHNRVVLPAFARQMADGSQLQVHALEGKLDADALFSKVDFSFASGGLALADKQARADIDKLRLDGAFSHASNGLWTGDFAFGADQVSVQAKAGALRVEKLAYRSRANLEGDWLSQDAEFTLAKISAGPDLSAGPAKFALRLAHLHAPTLAAFVRAQQSLDARSTDTAAYQAEVAALLGQALSGLLRHDPRVSLDELSLTTAEGTLTFHGMLKFAALPDPLPANLPGWVPLLEVDVDWNLSKRMLHALLARVPALRMHMLETWRAAAEEQAVADARLSNSAPVRVPDVTEADERAEVDAAVAMGWVWRDGEQLRGLAKLRRGELVVNNRPIPLPFLNPGAAPVAAQ
ncbi:MAG: YdgA family protein [Rhodocyclaceae bacterium]|nr:YdgA family protein [Rhodocyclaceae bacterium]